MSEVVESAQAVELTPAETLKAFQEKIDSGEMLTKEEFEEVKLLLAKQKNLLTTTRLNERAEKLLATAEAAKDRALKMKEPKAPSDAKGKKKPAGKSSFLKEIEEGAENLSMESLDPNADDFPFDSELS